MINSEYTTYQVSPHGSLSTKCKRKRDASEYTK